MTVNPSSRRFDYLTVALLAIAPVLRLAFLTGPVGSDDINYFHFAQRLVELQPFDELHHHGGRLVFLLLVGIPAALAGSIQAGAVASVFFLCLRDVLVAMFVRRRLGPVATAGAVGVLTLNGVSTSYAGLMLPDGLLSLTIFGSAVLIFLAAEVSGPRRYWAAALGGALAAASYSVKDSGILVAPLEVLWLLYVARRTPGQALRLVAVYLVAAAGVAAAEMMAYLTVSGDPFYRFHAISRVHNASIAPAESLYDALRHGLWNLASVTLPSTASTPLLAAAVVVWAGAALRADRFLYFALMGAFLAFYLIFGTSSFTRWMPLPVQDRYFEPIVPFLAVSVAGLVGRIAASRPRLAPTAAIGFPALLAVASLPGIVYNAGDIGISALGRNSAIAIGSLWRTEPAAVLYVTQQMHFALEPFVTAEVFRRLRVTPETGALPEGYHMLHPWKDLPTKDARAAEVARLPVWLVVDEDHRVLSAWAARPFGSRGAYAKAIVFVKTCETEGVQAMK